MTPPNVDDNSVWEALPADKFRHPDHRFEWTRAQFEAWAEGVASAHGYSVTFGGGGCGGTRDGDADEGVCAVGYLRLKFPRLKPGAR